MEPNDLRALCRVFAAAGDGWRDDAAVQAELVRLDLQLVDETNLGERHYSVAFDDNWLIVRVKGDHSEVSQCFPVDGKNLGVSVISSTRRGNEFRAVVYLVPNGSVRDTIHYLRGVIEVLERFDNQT